MDELASQTSLGATSTVSASSQGKPKKAKQRYLRRSQTLGQLEPLPPPGMSRGRASSSVPGASSPHHHHHHHQQQQQQQQQSLFPTRVRQYETPAMSTLSLHMDSSSSDSDAHRMPTLRYVGKQLYQYTLGSLRCTSCCRRRRLGYEEIHSSSSSSSSSTSSEDEEEKKKTRRTEEKIIRKRLNFHFMNPFQKWRYGQRRRFPFKMVLQLITVILVTAQVILFGNKKALLTNFFLGNSKTIHNVFLDMPSLDPDDLAVYTMNQLYDQLATGVSAYYNIKGIAVAPYDYDYDYFNDSDSGVPQLSVLYEIYDQSTFVFPVYPCGHGHHGNTSCIRQQIMKHINGSNISKIKKISMPFNLTSVYDVDQNEKQYVSCVKLVINIKFMSTLLKGNIPITVDVAVHFTPCNTTVTSNATVTSCSKQFLTAVVVGLDIVVFIVLLVYTLLCIRSIFSSFRLALASKKFFHRFYNKKLTWGQTWALQNLWFYGVVVGNTLNLLGTVLKIIVAFVQYQPCDSHVTLVSPALYLVLSIPLQDATTLILGLGVFFQWCGLLRFFSYFDTYNILLLTLKLSLPSVLRFAVCAFILYIAFLFCGWLVLGPYHAKFMDLSVTSECLFSLLNGDDMFATFKEMPQTPIAIWVFSKIYLYLFISLFIYVVLSVFIGLISESYETLNKHWYMRSKGFLREFALGGMAGWRKRRRAMKKMNPTFQEVQEVNTREGFILVNQDDGVTTDEPGEDNNRRHDNSDSNNSEATDGGYRSTQDTTTTATNTPASPFVDNSGSINAPKRRHTARGGLVELVGLNREERGGGAEDEFVSLNSISPVSLSPKMSQSLPAESLTVKVDHHDNSEDHHDDHDDSKTYKDAHTAWKKP